MSLEYPYNDICGETHTKIEPSDTLSWTDSYVDPRISHTFNERSSSGVRSGTKKSPVSVSGSISPPEITSQVHESLDTSRDKDWTKDWYSAVNFPFVDHNSGPRASSQGVIADAVGATERESEDKIVSRERNNPQSTLLKTVEVEVEDEEGRNSSSPDSAGKSADTGSTYKTLLSRSVASPTKPIPSSASISDYKPEGNAYVSSRPRGYASKQKETSRAARTRVTSDEEERARAQRYYAEISVNKNTPTSELKDSWLRGPNSRKRSHAAISYGPTERGVKGTSESIKEALASQASINQRIDDIYGKGAHRKKRYREDFMQARSLASEGSQNRGEMRADEPASLASGIAQSQVACSPIVRGPKMNDSYFSNTEDDGQITQSSGAFTNNLAMSQHGTGDILGGFNTTQHHNLVGVVDTESEQTQVLGDIAPSSFRPGTNQPILEEPSGSFVASTGGNTMQPGHHTLERQGESDRLEEQHRYDEAISNKLNELNRNLNAVVDLRGHMTSTLQNFATKIGKLETEAVTRAQQLRALQAVNAEQAAKIRVIEEKGAAQGEKIKILEARYSNGLGGLSNTTAPLGSLGSPFRYQDFPPPGYGYGSINTEVSLQGLLNNSGPGAGTRTSVPSFEGHTTAATRNGFGNNDRANEVATNHATAHGVGPNVQVFGLFGDSNNGPGRNASSAVSDPSYNTNFQTWNGSGRPYTSNHNL